MSKCPIPPSEQQRIVFFHPDLGIGGAERLIIDAAVGLQELGHSVRIYTSHCDPNHCFEEARDGTLDVRVRGNTVVPPSLFSTHRFVILCAILRQFHLLIHIALFTSELRNYNPSVYFVDQLSAGLIILRLLCPAVPTLFYCHFPDKLLVRGRQDWVKRLYRMPFDALERWSTGLADKVVVNSYFTKRVFQDAFPGLAVGEGQGRKIRNQMNPGVGMKELSVVYPCVRVDELEGNSEETPDLNDGLEGLFEGKKLILSINRFEEKKDISLAIRAFAILDKSLRKDVRLVIAGGYDPRVLENVTYHNQLLTLCSDHNLSTFTASASAAITSNATENLNQDIHHPLGSLSSIPPNVSVVFLLSIPTQLKRQLLHRASLLVYTPRGEHFGIVPLEAMAAGVPVLAANEGGPVESVVDSVTGWLRDPEVVEDWTRVMNEVLKANNMNEGSAKLKGMSRAGRERVRTEFSRGKMARRLEEELKELHRAVSSESRKPLSNEKVILTGIVGFMALAALPWFVMRAYFQ